MLIRSLSHSEFQAVFAGLGAPAFQAADVQRFLYKHGVDSFEAMTTLGRPLRAALAERFSAAQPEVADRAVGADGTVKLLLNWDRIPAEAVSMPSSSGGRTVCLSVQSGCRLKCAFCATGTLGLTRSLGYGEILDQVLILGGEGAVSRIVVMGMGEPLENLDELIPALRFMTDERCLGYSRKKITVSTVGLVPGLERLASEGPGVELAVSLHATRDTMREALIPVNRKYPIEVVLAAAAAYRATANAKVTLEYALLEGINDSDADATALARLARRYEMPVNLIRFNPVPGLDFTPSPKLNQFARLLAGKVPAVTVRRSRGADISAACGQLAGRTSNRADR